MSLTVSVLQGGTNSHATTSEEINFSLTDFISQGVIGTLTNTSGVAPATGSFAVNAQGSPDMTVAVSAGSGYVTATPTSGNSQVLRVKNSASTNVTIPANATGGTRFDWVYIKIDPDKAKDPASDASDVASLVTSRSTSATVDNGSPPTYGYAIAVVTVANGASSITNGNISDSRSQTGPNSLANDGMAAWKSWTPTLVNLSGGTQTYAKYVRVGKTIFFRFKYTLAGAGVAGAVTFTVPINFNSGYSASDTFQATVQYNDSSSTRQNGVALVGSSSTIAIFATPTSFANLSSTVPFTWAVNDQIFVSGSYEGV